MYTLQSRATAILAAADLPKLRAMDSALLSGGLEGLRPFVQSDFAADVADAAIDTDDLDTMEDYARDAIAIEIRRREGAERVDLNRPPTNVDRTDGSVSLALEAHERRISALERATMQPLTTERDRDIEAVRRYFGVSTFLDLPDDINDAIERLLS